MATHSGGSATPNVSELAATWTSAGQLKSWTETVHPPGGGNPVTKSGSYDWAQDGLKTQATIDSQSSAFEWFVDGNEKTFTPTADSARFPPPTPKTGLYSR